MQFDKIIKIFFVLCFLISCKNEAQEKNKITTKVKSEYYISDFFKKSKDNFYTMLIDESNISDHPIISHLDCEDSYFTIHFVPKSDSLKNFWKKRFFTNYDFINNNEEENDKYIKQKLINKNQYNIFSFQINKRYLNVKNGCTEESVNVKNNAKAQVYFFENNSWNLIKEFNSDILPPYADNDFFIRSFPNLFSTQKTDEFYNKDNSKNNTLFKINHNFYNEETTETILVLKDSKTTDSFESNHFNLPIKIYKKDKLWKSNNHLIPKTGNNCVSEGFSTIVAKDNYFTIEQQLCYDYQILVSSFTTFKVVDNEIYLHKYGENYFDKSNHDKKIPSKVWTQKDFGKLKFEDVTNEFLIKLRMK